MALDLKQIAESAASRAKHLDNSCGVFTAKDGSGLAKLIEELAKCVAEMLRSEIGTLKAKNERLRTALRGVVTAWVNPADGGEYERGEVPALDAAREALNSYEQSTSDSSS